MCGVTGFFDPTGQFQSDQLGAVVTQMANTLSRRGPDGIGTWVDSKHGVALGHRRLAILDLSPHGHQPMVSASGRYLTVYNGEVYNYRELREELGSLGQDFRGGSDTEVVLAAIEVWGVKKALARFVGMFALALWDRKEKVLYLVRDRMGEKPLYYGWAGKFFLFGSELKALRSHPSWEGDIGRDALALFMRHNYVPSPYSIYKGIHKLPPGCILELNGNVLAARSGFSPYPRHRRQSGLCPIPYWSLKSVVEAGSNRRNEAPDKEIVEHFDRLLRKSIGQKMIADVPLGALLSGGIDSSLVVAVMQAESPNAVKTFTIGFHEERYDESKCAKAVARHLGTDHVELCVTPEQARDVIPKLPYVYDEPFSDSSQIPTFLVSSLARQEVTVALSGDGGDELFGGYDRYQVGASIWGKAGWIPMSIRRLAANTLRGSPVAVKGFLARMLGQFLPEHVELDLTADKLQRLLEVVAVGTAEQMYRQLVSHWKNPEKIVIGGVEGRTVLTEPDRWPETGTFTEKMMYLDTMTYLPDDILTKVDRASMAVSLEVRVPLLDHRIVEFAWRLPFRHKVRQGQSKWLPRQVLYKYVPKELVERPKKGFAIPVGPWLRGPLREWAESLLDEKRLTNEGFFDSAPIRRKWKEHLSGRHDWQYYLWDVLMFQAWNEQTS